MNWLVPNNRRMMEHISVWCLYDRIDNKIDIITPKTVWADIEVQGEKTLLEPEDLSKNIQDENPNLSEAEQQYKKISQMYAKMLKSKRSSHLEAINVMNKLDIHKQTKTIEMLLEKLFSVLHENEVKLMSNGYVPGLAFPKSENLLEAFSMAIENTFFLGEIVLRFPDISHKFMDPNREYLRLAKWAIGFANETKIFDESSDGIILSLMAQELNIIERLPNFINPFTNKNKEDAQANSNKQAQTTQKVKQKREKKSKGPKLSNKRNEL